MAKIQTYPDGAPLDGKEKLIGTDVNDNNATKNFTVQDVADYTLDQSNVVNSVTGTAPVVVNPTSGDANVSLATITGVANDYQYANITVDQYGRVTAAGDGTPVTQLNGLDGAVTLSPGANVSITPGASNELVIASTGGGATGVTQIDTGIGLEGGPITTTGTIDLSNTGVAGGTYTTPQITVNLQGQITSASNINVDLQHVLDNGALANNVGITLTNGGVIATSGVFNSTNVSNATCLDLTVDEQILDRNGNFGTDGQVLVADNSGSGGVVWTDPGTYVATATVSSAQLIAATPVEIVAAPGAGKYIQVVSASAKYNYGSVTYSFAAPLKLYTNSSAPQFELDEAYLQVPVSQIRAMSLTTSGALTENTELNFAPASIPAANGDGDLQLNVQYRIVEF